MTKWEFAYNTGWADAMRAEKEKRRDSVSEYEENAKRYRYLRDTAKLSVRDVFGAWSEQLNDGLDAAIDAAQLAKEA